MPVLIGGTVNAFADSGEELSENITSIIDSLDLTEIQSYLDAYGNSFIFSFGDTAKEIVTYLIKGNLGINYGSYINELFSVLFKGVTELIPAFSQVVAISILCAVSSGAEGGIIGKTTAKVIRLACMALIMLVLSSMLFGIVSSAVACIVNIKRQVEIITPMLVTLTILTGGAEAGAIYQPSALFLSSGAIDLVSGFIFPATLAVVVLNFMSKLNPEISFTGVSALIKSVMKWTIGITVTVFGLFITVQSSVSSMFNGVFFKITKYLVGNSVPIVGNFLSAGVDMVVMSGTVVRGSLGIMGIIMLLGEIIQPVVMLTSFSVMLKITAAIAQPLGEASLYSLFTEFSKDIEFLIAGILMAAFLYLLVIMLIINSTFAFL
ncbi:MAG: stage III sporulation protein AE [Clostridia bacterium]|nr:stage III sporulation protein AE [Clostridia bacterium]